MASNSSPAPGANIPLRPQVDRDWMELPRPLVDAFTANNRVHAAYGVAHGAHHAAESQRTITQTAETALLRAPSGTERKAMLLHVGNVPVSELVQAFDHTTLVDIDPVALAQAAESVPGRLHKKMTLRLADLTDRTGAFVTDMWDTVGGHARLDDFYRAAKRLLERHARFVGAPDLRRGYAFVCSHMALSQLMAVPNDYVNTTMLLPKYGRVPSALAPEASEAEYDYIAALTGLADARYIRHVDHLSALVTAAGAVHVSDGHSVTQTRPDDKVTRRIFNADVVQPAIDRDFVQIAPPAEWTWNASSITDYHVKAYSLLPSMPTSN